MIIGDRYHQNPFEKGTLFPVSYTHLKLKAFATDIEGMLEESGFDLAYYNILYVGGGAIIMRRFGNAREDVYKRQKLD